MNAGEVRERRHAGRRVRVAAVAVMLLALTALGVALLLSGPPLTAGATVLRITTAGGGP